MKLLLFSDLHANVDQATRLVEMAAEADVVIGAGDFGRMRQDLDTAISILSRIPPETPAVVVPGNAESYEELREACLAWPGALV